MLRSSRVAFIGSGIMAESMINGMLGRKLLAPDHIQASGPRAARGEELARKYGVGWTTDNAAAVDGADIVVLAVKPQVLSAVLPELCGRVKRQALVLTIIAGARIGTISRELNEHLSIVRAMPNTPAQISQGITVWTATGDVGELQRGQAREILRALGEELFVEQEGYLDMATALSGTGPAYVFLFMEALIDAGVHMGFSRRVAENLVLQTMQGAVAFARQSALHPAELRNMVTSPGGTSAEAIYQMEKGALRTVLSKAVWAAYQKSRLLGETVGKAEPRKPVDA